MKKPKVFRTDEEKIEIVHHWQEHGMKATIEKYGHADVSVYTWNKELGLYPTTGVYKSKPRKKAQPMIEEEPKKKRSFRKKNQPALVVPEPEMIEIRTEPTGETVVTLYVSKLVIRSKNVEVISE